MMTTRGSTPEQNAIFNLLEIATDPAKHAARLKQLQEETARNQAYIEARVKLDDIDNMHAKAKEAAEQSQALIEEASRKAEGIKASAQAVADTLTGDANDLKTRTEIDRATFEEHIRQKSGELADRENAVAVKESALKDRESRLDALEKELLAQKAEIDRKKALLAQL